MDETKKNCAEECAEEETVKENASECDCGAEESAKESEEKCSFKDKKKIKKAEAEIEKLKEELADEKDKYMRLFAEFDNFRKRAAKEKEGVYTDANFDALLQILPILDNLERAAQFTTEDADSPMAKGLELTLKSFIESMNNMGVYEIEALGKEFDPNLHNAVMHVEDDNAGENTVVEVFMMGYAKGDKVLRYSMVKVAN